MGAGDNEGDLHPRLCGRCQSWRRWKLPPDFSVESSRIIHYHRSPQFLTYDHLYTNKHYLVCSNALLAVKKRIPDLMRKSLMSSELVVSIRGPINPVGSHNPSLFPGWEQTQRRRIEQRLPLGFWIQIDVSFRPANHPTQAGPDPNIPEPVSLTARRQAYHMLDGTLHNIGDGSIPHFDISNLKG